MDKLISVIIPTYNRPEKTARAVQSVNCARPHLVEIIVVDDCSTTPYLYGASHNAGAIPVRSVRLARNSGPGIARRAGVANAEGQYIAFLDSDDCYNENWIDHVIVILESTQWPKGQRLMISGKTEGENAVGGAVRKMLSTLPVSLRLMAARMVAVFFNPFYTPSIVMDKQLCQFKDGLRYCEDFFSTTTALFNADFLELPNIIACQLNRQPNSVGGLSAARKKMFSGEMEVRRSMLSLPHLPWAYKALVPLGMVYQLARTAIKRVLRKSK